LALPQDVQAEAFDFPTTLFEPRVHRIPRARPDRAALERAADLISRSQRPLIVAGGGVIYSDASDALAAFATRFGIPVVETQAGKGSLAWDHPLQLGAIGVSGGSAGNAAAREADLVLAVGTRLADFTTASWTAWQDPDVRFVALNVVELDAAKAAAAALVADARVGLEELEAALDGRGWAGVAPERRAVNERLRTAWNAEVDRVLHLHSPVHLSQPEVIRLVNEAARPGDVLVQAAGGLPGDLHKLWRTERPGDYHVEYGYSTMGYEIAGGLGVKMASPGAEVYVMVGDGSYLMLSAELTTSVQEGRRLTVVLLDNHGFQCIKNLSGVCGGHNEFNSFRFRDPATDRLSGSNLPIDFAANAASLGAHVLRADSAAELAAALRDARAADRTTVIVVEVDPSVAVPDYGSWWDVPVAEVSTSESVREARRAYDKHVTTERRFV
jgi:3D-(3,5/4)-trihydroxycyclohexane-1,2-dione acylhydrolase (decyclizing)